MKKIFLGLFVTTIMASFSAQAEKGKKGKSKKVAKTACCNKTKCCKTATSCDKTTCAYPVAGCGGK